MSFTEAMFWVGLTALGTGLYFLVERASRRVLWVAWLVVAVGVVAMGYSVYAHYYPGVPKPPLWPYLVVLTWIVIGFDYYEKRSMRRALANFETERDRPKQSEPPPPPPRSDMPVTRDTETKPESEKRIFVNVTPEDLTGLFKDQLSVQAAKMAEAFITKWMTVSGTLADVIGTSEFFRQVTFADRSVFKGSVVYMYFRGQDWFDRLSTLRPNEPITVKGQIKQITSQEVHLDNCELVDS